MTATAIYAGRILTPQEELLNNVIVVEGGRITGIGNRDEVHIPPGARDYVASEMTVVPGFVDVHIHGAGGHDVMEGTPEALDAITATVARFGTTSIVATTVTAPVEDTCRSLEGIAHYVRSHEKAEENTRAAAEIVGIHLEGPFINKARRGVHPPESIATPSIEVLEKFRAAADGLVRIVTVAPEIPGALQLIARAVADGLVVAVGHTDADYDQARAAFKAGARHAVHVYNAMRPFTHRDPGRDQRDYDGHRSDCGNHCGWRARGWAGDSGAGGDQGIRHGAAGERRDVCHRDARRKIPLGKF